VTELFDPFPLSAPEAARIAREPRKDAFYLALRGEVALGLSMLRGFDEGYEVPSFGIFVDHEHHGQGIGRELTVRTIEQARRRGCPAVRLTVYSDNRAARRLYESLGFLEQERRRAERAGHPGETHEKIVMRLDLGG
jgi:ribosomal protein S18 acetylase RimI-like enzyme